MQPLIIKRPKNNNLMVLDANTQIPKADWLLRIAELMVLRTKSWLHKRQLFFWHDVDRKNAQYPLVEIVTWDIFHAADCFVQ